MGGSYSAAKVAPAGGVLLVLQTSSCETPSLKDGRRLQIAPVSDSDWESFRSKVENACEKMTNEKWNYVSLALMVVGFLLSIAMLAYPRNQMMTVGIGYTVLFLGGCAFYGVRYHVSSRNEPQDAAIRAACEELQKQGLEAGAPFMVEYRTEHVGKCRPKGTTPFRGIAFSQAAPLIATVGSPAHVPTVIGSVAKATVVSSSHLPNEVP